MTRASICVVAIGCVLVFSAVANAQCGSLSGECLVNGNLDIGTAGGMGMPGSAVPWTLVNVGNATAAQFQPGFADSTGVNGIWYRAFLGGGVNMNPLVSADLSQSVVVPTGGTYRLTFDYLVEQNFTAAGLTASLSGSGGVTANLDLLTVPRVATGGGFTAHPAAVGLLEISGVNAGDTLTVSLAMVDGEDAGANPQSVVADRFSLVRVPEPASALLGLIGLLGVLAFVRRQ